jgi:hypothetical protein
MSQREVNAITGRLIHRDQVTEDKRLMDCLAFEQVGRLKFCKKLTCSPQFVSAMRYLK